MKRLLMCGVLALVPAVASAQSLTLDLGGTGTYGPLNVTSNTTITLPPDGVIQATSVNIAAGATLKFTRNARNTGVIIVSQGDVVIDGTIDVSGSAGTVGAAGAGGPGGGNGGNPVLFATDDKSPQFWPLTRLGTPNPLGAAGGVGSSGNACTTYGAGGGGGGGALVIFSNTKISSSSSGATINAAGGVSPTTLPGGSTCSARIQAGAGSDGLVRLVAPTLDAAALTIFSGQTTFQRLFSVGTPTVENGSLQSVAPTANSEMDAFVPNPVAASIVSVDGTALPAGTESYAYAYPTGATSTTIVTNATGCNPGQLTMTLNTNGFLTGCTGDTTHFTNNGNATTTWTCTISSTPSSAHIFASASCQQ